MVSEGTNNDTSALNKPAKVEMNLFENISNTNTPLKTNAPSDRASDDLHSLAKEEADFFNPSPSTAEGMLENSYSFE